MRALIVDDEEIIGLMTKNLLSRKGIPTDEATSLKQASQRINVNNYDLYFLDLNLPDGSGFDLVPQIKQKDHTAKVVIISAYDGSEETKRADELGVDAFISKPFTGKDIHEVVDEFINN